MTIDLQTPRCPLKVIGADPTVANTYMPSMDLGALEIVDYDFLPESTHLLQLEEPEACAALAVEFIEEQGLG